MITRARLEEMRKRCEAATEGPINVDRVEWETGAITYELDTPNAPGDGNKLCFGFEIRMDAEFVAAAYIDLPRLLDEVKALQDALAGTVEGLPRFFTALDGSARTDLGDWIIYLSGLLPPDMPEDGAHLPPDLEG